MLEQSKTRYQAIVEDQTELICRFFKDGTLTFVNPAYCHYFNKTPEELLGHHFIPQTPEADRHIPQQHLTALSKTNPVVTYEHRVILTDGTIRWQQWTNRAIFNARGELIEYQAVGRDITTLKNTEAELRRSQAYYQAIVDDCTDLIIRYLPDRTITFANKACCDFLGKTPEETIGQNLQAIMSESDYNLLGNLIQTLTPEHPVVNREEKRVLANGEVRSLQWTDRALFDGDRDLVEIQAVGRDLTAYIEAKASLWRSTELEPALESLHHEIQQRQQIQEELRTRKERYRSVVEALQEGVVLQETDGRIRTFNASATRILGLSAEQLRRRTFFDLYERAIQADGSLFPAEQYPALVALQTGQPCSDVMMGVYQPDRTLRWLSLNAQPLFRDDETQPYAVVTSFSDITLRVQAENLLKETNQQITNILESITDAFIAVDREWKFTYLNPKAEQLLAKSQAALLGKSIWEAFPEAIMSSFNLQYRKALSEQASVVFESFYPPVNSWFEIRAYPARDGLAVYFQDITTRKQAEAQLMRALAHEKELNEVRNYFVSTISHEFRLPLTTIQSAVELLENYDLAPAEKQEYFQQIYSAMQTMLLLLEDVLLFGKMESGNQAFFPERIDLKAICQQIISDFQLIDGKKHVLNFVQPAQQKLGWVDPKLVKQILNNLLSNALKYSPENSEVTLELTYQQEQAILKIQDRGVGIPQSDRKHLFTLFYRATNVQSIQGTGLGLAIVKKCVELHQGTITLESEVGAGTTFTIILPLNAKP